MRKIIYLLLGLFIASNTISQKITPASPSFCEGGSVVLTAPTGGSYQWQSSSTNTDPWINVGTANTLDVGSAGWYRVVVSNGKPEADTIEAVQVIKNLKPVVNFTFNNDNACSGTSIQFNATETGVAPFKYSWDFGDGKTSNSANPTYAYAAFGCGTATFTVKLTVTDANGCTNTVSRTINVLRKPDVQIKDVDVFNPFNNCNKSPTPEKPDYKLTIDNASPGSGCITSYSIDWGDGTTASNISFPLSHTYTKLGAFNLVVTAKGDNGCSNSKTYVVANQSNPAGGLGTKGNTTGLCAPATIPFTVSNWQLNSPGTKYVLNFGDGTSLTLDHPLNAGDSTQIIDHTYDKSSCPSATFTATLSVQNACATTPYSAGNIQINTQPKADFLTPANTCVNQAVCFSNATVTGSYGGQCSTVTDYEWDFGDGTSHSSSVSPCHTYSLPGIYTITLKASNPCGASTITKQICITAKPAPSFTLDKTESCAPVVVNATNTTNVLAGCAPATYNWAVAYTAAYCGTTAGWSFANSTNASSINPSFNFSNSGIYTVTLSVTNPCGTFTTSQTVTVKSPPKVSLPSFPNSCGSVTLSPAATVSNCGTSALSYLWTFDGSATSTSPTPSITFSGVGTHTISLAVTNECGTTTVTRNVIIDPIPSLMVPENKIYCASETSGALNFTTNGTSISWINSDTRIGLAGSGVGNISSFVVQNSTAIPITATITATSKLSNCTAQSSFTITVNPTPSKPIVTTPVTYCQNAIAAPLSATATAGHTLLWYSTSSGGTGSSTPPTPATNTVGTASYYVSQINIATGCEGPRAEIKVTIYPVPIITASYKDPSGCSLSDGTITISGLISNTPYLVNYWQNGNPLQVGKNSDASAVSIPHTIPLR